MLVRRGKRGSGVEYESAPRYGRILRSMLSKEPFFTALDGIAVRDAGMALVIDNCPCLFI